MHYYRYTQFAAAYGQGGYGNDVYNAQSTSGTGGSTTSGGNSGGNPGSVLTNTGFDIALIVIIACIVTFIALIVRFWKRPAKKQAEPTPSETGKNS